MKQRYDSYKTSGIDWIGEIPSHWEIMRMRYLCDMVTGDKDTVNKVDDGQYPFYVRSPQIERINSYTFDGEAVLMAGDGVGAGKVVHYANGKFDFHQRVYNFHNFRGIKGILLYQYLKTLFKYKIEEGGAKNTVDSVRQPWLKDFPICVPPLAEQEAIAAWLEDKCGEIDAATAKVDREIELIDELKQSEISRVVTRGLTPDVPLRPSGIDWIGDVPEHWKIYKIKHLSPVYRGASPRPIDNPIYFDDEGEFSWVRIADVTSSDRYLESTTQRLSELGASLSVKRYPGDFFLSIAGTVGKPIITKIKCCIHDGFVWFPLLKINPEFLYYIFMTGQPYKGLGKFGTQLNLNTDTVGNISIPVPPLKEIDQILNYLDKKCAEIDGLKAKLVKKRETLKELRQSIISEVVTGKRKVI